MTDKVHKIIKKETIGYRYVTKDHVQVEYHVRENKFIIDNMVDIIEIEASTHTIFMLEELLRYVKEDKEENDQATL